MNTIELKINGKTKNIQTPYSWNELTQEQFIEVVKCLTNGKEIPISMFDIPLWNKLSAVQRHYIRDTFSFLHQKPDISRLLLQSFTVNEVEYIGYQAGFSNTTWEEFMFADQYFMNNQYLHAIAVLYREAKPNHDGQSDIRMPFSVYAVPDRLKKIETLDKNSVAAIALNYQALREINISDKYTHIFSSPPSEGLGEAFSWVPVHRNILSEHFFEEEKFLKSNVHAVLHRMNALIEESRKSKK
jgi:hypothetical protein